MHVKYCKSTIHLHIYMCVCVCIYKEKEEKSPIYSKVLTFFSSIKAERGDEAVREIFKASRVGFMSLKRCQT